mgnify:CR=1 FL=1|tara:strand:+ start:641 stop:778 length:138 start_codon:yes stop_codon:yes gene_type:complete
MGDYVKIITPEKKYLVLSSMKAFLSKLRENQFLEYTNLLSLILTK